VTIDGDMDVETALARVASARFLDWTRGGLPSAVAPSPDSVLLAAPESFVVPGLNHLAESGNPAARVWATTLLLQRSPELGRRHVERLRHDTSPVEVNTCLVGYRRVCDWARSVSHTPNPPVASRRRLRLLVLLLATAVAWLAVELQ
jgi:hypothetical protein